MILSEQSPDLPSDKVFMKVLCLMTNLLITMLPFKVGIMKSEKWTRILQISIGIAFELDRIIHILISVKLTYLFSFSDLILELVITLKLFGEKQQKLAVVPQHIEKTVSLGRL